MMEYRIVFSETSLNDIKKLYDYISYVLHNNAAAVKLAGSIFETVKKLSLFPKSYPLCKEKMLKERNVRYVVVNNYKILYVVIDEKSEVLIARVIYSKRNIDKIFV